MDNSLQLISFNIDAWHALSPGLSGPEQWRTWSRQQNWPDEATIDTPLIPPMMRRRMSVLSKLAVQVALELLQTHPVDYLVFASRHGELHRSAALIQALLEGEEASPMAFSQSVHNTAAGLTTIAGKLPLPVTSVSACDNTFLSAIMDAWLYLEQYPQAKVLLIDFDQRLPDVYQPFEEHQYRDYALGLVLSAGAELQLCRAEHAGSESTLPQGLAFLSHYLSDARSWQTSSRLQTWQWERR